MGMECLVPKRQSGSPTQRIVVPTKYHIRSNPVEFLGQSSPQQGSGVEARLVRTAKEYHCRPTGVIVQKSAGQRLESSRKNGGAL
jgi:hypothetical protein